MLQDFRYAYRVLSSRPGFTLVAALSLSLGIGANAAIFGVVDTFWFRPMAVPDAGRIVRVVSATGQDAEGLWFSMLDVLTEARGILARSSGVRLNVCLTAPVTWTVWTGSCAGRMPTARIPKIQQRRVIIQTSRQAPVAPVIAGRQRTG